MDELVRAARLAPSVGPFTLRRLFLRARIFGAGNYSAEDVRTALPSIRDELREILSADEFQQAQQAIEVLIAREVRARGAPTRP